MIRKSKINPQNVGIIVLLAATLALLSFHVVVAQEKPTNPFAIDEIPQAPRLSPDGHKLAYYDTVDGHLALLIQDLDDPNQQIVVIKPDIPHRHKWFDWATNERLVFADELDGYIKATPTLHTRLFSIAADGSNLTNLVKNARTFDSTFEFKTSVSRIRRADSQEVDLQIKDKVIQMPAIGQYELLMVIDHDGDGQHTVRRVNVNTGDYTEVTGDFGNIQTWIADQQGNLRFGLGVDGNKRHILFRKNPHDSLVPFEETRLYKEGYRPLAFLENPNKLVAIRYFEGKPTSLHLVDMKSLAPEKILFSHPKYSIDQIIYEPKAGSVVYGKPIGVRYVTDYPTVKIFNEKWKNYYNRIQETFSEASVEIVSSSDDESRMIVKVMESIRPATFYLWETDKNTLSKIQQWSEDIDPESLTTPQKIEYTARDGMSLEGYFYNAGVHDGEPAPLVVLPHGGPHLRDFITYDFWAQFLVSRGYSVFQPNYRGSAGYSEAFRHAGNKEWGGKIQDDIADGTRFLIEKGYARKNSICIAGLSFGGYSALVSSYRYKDLYSCAISVNGITDLPQFIRFDQRFVGGERWTQIIGDLDEDREALRAASPRHNIDQINIPVLVIYSENDRRIPYRFSASFVRALKRERKTVESIRLEEGGHELRTEKARAQMLEAMLGFLDKNLKPKASY